MKKTIHISKGQICKFEDLTCERIVCNGVLKVAGTITAKRIQGDGVISATEIRCISCVQSVVSAEKIVCNALMARHVSATEVHAVSSLSVSTFIEHARIITAINDSVLHLHEIGDMQLAEYGHSLSEHLLKFNLMTKDYSTFVKAIADYAARLPEVTTTNGGYCNYQP